VGAKVPEDPVDPRHSRLGRRLTRLWHAVQQHETLLWSLHSSYALLVGIGFMWLGTRHYVYLRLAVFHLAFIWTTSLVAVPVLERTRLPAAWQGRARRLVNYFHRAFYQQLLFFLLPIYYASATWGARNMAFVGLVGVSAAVSTLDVFYDRHLSMKRGLMGVFFAFNLFVGLNAMLPVVWSIDHLWTLRLSGALALLAFLTMAYRLGDLRRLGTWLIIAASALSILAVVEWGREFVPPAPLRLVAPQFGYGFDTDRLQLQSPAGQLSPGFSAPLYALTPIYAPLGLDSRVAHRWYVGDTPLSLSAFITVRGGRAEGFRMWTRRFLRPVPAGSDVRVDVLTEAGQLIGRTSIPVVSPVNLAPR
jgi:hypothetical protein